MATLQVRSLDARLYEALGKRAAIDNRSISQEVIAILKEHLSEPSSRPRQATELFLELAGTWQDARSAKEIAGTIRKARKSIHRFKGAGQVPVSDFVGTLNSK